MVIFFMTCNESIVLRHGNYKMYTQRVDMFQEVVWEFLVAVVLAPSASHVVGTWILTPLPLPIVISQ